MTDYCQCEDRILRGVFVTREDGSQHIVDRCIGCGKDIDPDSVELVEPKFVIWMYLIDEAAFMDVLAEYAEAAYRAGQTTELSEYARAQIEQAKQARESGKDGAE